MFICKTEKWALKTAKKRWDGVASLRWVSERMEGCLATLWMLTGILPSPERASCSTDARVSCHCMDVDSSVQTL